jgi:hypothetical protein
MKAVKPFFVLHVPQSDEMLDYFGLGFNTSNIMVAVVGISSRWASDIRPLAPAYFIGLTFPDAIDEDLSAGAGNRVRPAAFRRCSASVS